ncbi:MAG: hypothetical protein ACJ75B_11600 [Flavisolibacter sp.]
MATIITALIVLGILTGAILLLMWVHRRDQKRAEKKMDSLS